MVRAELRRIKSPGAARSRIEFYERENKVDIYNMTDDEQKEISQMRDLKAKKISQRI